MTRSRLATLILPALVGALTLGGCAAPALPGAGPALPGQPAAFVVEPGPRIGLSDVGWTFQVPKGSAYIVPGMERSGEVKDGDAMPSAEWLLNAPTVLRPDGTIPAMVMISGTEDMAEPTDEHLQAVADAMGRELGTVERVQTPVGQAVLVSRPDEVAAGMRGWEVNIFDPETKMLVTMLCTAPRIEDAAVIRDLVVSTLAKG